MAKAKSNIWEAFLLSRAMEGATKPKIIRGTRKKMTWPESCFTTMMALSSDSLTTRPAKRPMITAKSSRTIVLAKIFFNMVFPFYYDLYRFLGGKYRDIIYFCGIII